MTQKTAMQELIEWFENTPNKPLTHEIHNKIKELIPKERQQIIDAYSDGYYSASCVMLNGTLNEINTSPENYYNQTYVK